MNVQRHARIEHIKQLSGHLQRALTFAQYVLWLGWPLIFFFAYAPEVGNFKGAIGQGPSQPFGSFQPYERAALLVNGMAMLALTQLVVLHSRRLMAHFHQGQVFDSQSLSMARKAINCGLGLLGLHVAGQVAAVVYLGKFHLPGPLLTAFYGFLFFGMLHVMLWALEIGRDLKDDAELTI